MGLEPRWILEKMEIEHGIKDRCFLDQTLCQASYKGDEWSKLSWALPHILQQVFDFLSLCSIPFKYKDEKAKILGEICAKLADFQRRIFGVQIRCRVLRA